MIENALTEPSTIFGISKAFFAGIVLFAAYTFIVLEKVPKVTIALVGAAITLVFGIVSTETAFSHVDFGVLALLISMMIIVHIGSRSGVFTWIAYEMLKHTKGKPLNILIALCVFTAVASAFLDNVTTVIILMPITFTIAKELKIDPVPLLISEVFASNIGGTATLIGDPPNIIIGSVGKLSFNDFLIVLTPIVTVIFIISLVVLAFMFRKDLVSTPELMAKAANFDNSKTITDKPLMIRSMTTLGLVILGFVLHSALHIDAYMIAMLGASILLLFEQPKEALQDVEWTTIFFFIGLFIVIGGLTETGGMSYLANKFFSATNGDLTITTMVVLWMSGFLVAILGNIPYTVAMVPMINELQGVMNLSPLWWALSLGACLGGNATIIGAAANVIVSESAYVAGYPISFMRFMKYGLLVTLISLVLSSIYLYFRFLT